jgi:hypothetical protein
VRRALGLLLAGLLLAGCAHTPTMSTTARPLGVASPTVNIAVPLNTVACLPDDTCVAVGATGLTTAPTTAGQVWSHGRWSVLATPDLPGAAVQQATCAPSFCLLAGATATGAFLWRFTGDAVVTVPFPAGVTVHAMSCTDTRCLLVGLDPSGTPTWWTSLDQGATWQFQSTNLSPSTLSAVRTLALAPDGSAWAATPRGLWHVTAVGANVWTATPTPTTTPIVAGPSCNMTRCAIVTGASGQWHLATRATTSVAPSWRLARGTSATSVRDVACGATACLALGDTGTLERVTTRGWQPVQPTYFQGPATSVACGRSVCVATSATTVAVVPTP